MEETKAYKLLMYNDDIHSFPYIMACLIRFCEQEPLQAEQCALLAHNNGKCSVKSGDFIELLEIHNNFERVNVKTEIVAHESYMHKQ
jgi:ATP-dependent Clp protease adaptor protein ClpS